MDTEFEILKICSRPASVNKNIFNEDNTILQYKIIKHNKFDTDKCCTPNNKIRRKYINEKYKKLIDSIYL